MTRHRQPRGFALLIVLWSVVLLALLTTGITAAGRSDLQLAGNIRRAAAAQAAADGAVFNAAFHLTDAGPRAWPADGRARSLAFGTYTVTVTVADEGRKLNPNYAPPELMAAVLTAAGADRVGATALASAIVRWHEVGNIAAEVARYRNAGMAAAPTGQPFASVDELGLVIGMNPALLARVRPFLSVYAVGPLNVAQADPVLRAAFLSLGAREPPPPSPHPTVVDVRADAQARDGSRFVRHAVVELGKDRAGRAFRILTWDAPPG